MLQEIVVVQSDAYRTRKRIMKKCIEFKAEIEEVWVLN